MCQTKSVVVVADEENGAYKGGFDKVRKGSRLKCDSGVLSDLKSQRTENSQGMSWFPFVSSSSFLDE